VEMVKKTYVVIPPPPTPAMARAAISSFIFRASPQSRDPNAKTEYENSKQDLRPKMSLIFPYSGLCARSFHSDIMNDCNYHSLETCQGQHVASCNPARALKLMELTTNGCIRRDYNCAIHGNKEDSQRHWDHLNFANKVRKLTLKGSRQKLTMGASEMLGIGINCSVSESRFCGDPSADSFTFEMLST
jgi:hypothetical protein